MKNEDKREPVELSEEAKQLVVKAVTVFVNHVGVDRLEAMDDQQQKEITDALMASVNLGAVEHLVEILHGAEGQ